MADKEAKSTTRKIVANDQADYYSRITSITVNGKNAYELKGNFLDDLHKNAFSGTNREDAVEHIEYFLKIIDLIDLPNVNLDKLRIVVFPFSLVRDAWSWFDRIKGSITSWVDLTAKFLKNTTRLPALAKLMKNTRTIGFMNGIKMCHGCTKNHGLTLEYGLNPLQLCIVVSHLIIKVGIRNGLPVAREKMDIVMEETCQELACNTSKSGRSGIMCSGALLHNTIAQDMRKRPLNMSFDKKSCID
ncbi:hypothetical protein Tco_0318603 [Tanacetum coccineum]